MPGEPATQWLAPVVRLHRSHPDPAPSSATIVVLSPGVSRWHVGRAVIGVDEVVRPAGCDLQIVEFDETVRDARFAPLQGLARRRRLVGVLVLDVSLTPAERIALQSLQVPVVALGFVDGQWASVGIDETAAAAAAVDHLIGLGHRRIGYVGIEPAFSSNPAAEARRRGYRLSLVASGLIPDRRLQALASDTVAGGHAAMTLLLGVRPRPTAVFVQSDEMAFGALSAVRDADLRCPGDLSVIGFGDHEMAGLLDLTTVAAPVAEQGRLAAQRLLAAIDGEPAEGAALLPTRLVVRATTARVYQREGG